MTQFEQAIKRYLDQRATIDQLFAEKYKNQKKSIEQCCKYIESDVCNRIAEKNGAQSYTMTNREVFGLAVHYYDEENIEIKPLKAQTKVFQSNVTYTPTEEEKEQARKNAMKRLEDEEIAKMRAKPGKPKSKEPETSQQMSLF